MDTGPEVQETLRRWAEHLNGITERQVDQPFTDVLTDGLVWSDETIHSTPFEVISCLRFVRHHRTGIIIGERRRFEDIWRLARQLFPRWVGFHPDRCRPFPELADLYARSKIRKKSD